MTKTMLTPVQMARGMRNSALIASDKSGNGRCIVGIKDVRTSNRYLTKTYQNERQAKEIMYQLNKVLEATDGRHGNPQFVIQAERLGFTEVFFPANKN